MAVLLAFWSHALAALLFATLLVWQLRGNIRASGQKLLLAGLLLTAAWAWIAAVAPHSNLAGHAETARNLVWIGLLYALAAGPRADGQRLQGVQLVYGAVALVLGLQFAIELLTPVGRADPAAVAILRATAAAGALVLVHNLYGQAAPASRNSIRLVMLGLALSWIYDLNLYTVAYWQGGTDGTLHDARGAFLALTVPLFALGARRTDGWRLKLSRAATFQSLGLVAICSYFAVMALLATVLRGSDWSWLKTLAMLLLAGMTVGAVALVPSPRLRGWMKVKAAKHLFEHRYDYRAEWLRFADTLGRSGPAAPPLAERVVKALADIVDAPAGLLLTEEEGLISIAASWTWPGRLPGLGPAEPLAELWQAMAPDGRVLELDAHRGGWSSPRDSRLALPPSLLDEGRLWAGVPLIHHDRTVGLVLLAAPEPRRALDWEDFDLLRTASRQAASSLAEAHGQQALMDARAFEDFNRRFAFILHDIKNLVSQLSLLARNAERHAENPEFRADMIATLQGSVGKMNDLLARLSPRTGSGAAPGIAVFPLRQVLLAAVAAGRGAHEVRLLGPTGLMVRGDAAALEQAIVHLLRNAVEASPPDQPVTVRVAAADGRIVIEIVDRGSGMDAEFLRSRLFQPFASTKDGGFGIGAYEARTLIHAMGGQLGVESRPGEGTRFTIHLAAAAEQPESLSA